MIQQGWQVLVFRKRVSSVLVALVASALALGACSGRGVENKASARSTDLQALLDRIREDLKAPGAILAVKVGEEPVTVLASGLANRETGRVLTPSTPYFQGSITKTYTAVTVLRLIEEGKLSLDDTVAHFFPEFPRGGEITVRHLLTQTSGLKDFYMHLYYRPDRDEMIRFVTKRWSEDELLALAGRFGHWFDPGTDWDYSSTNYYLLGVIVERVTGEPLTAAYRRFLYQPLGLEHTWMSEHEEARGTVPTGYMGPVEGWKHSEMFGELGATTVLDRSSVEWSAGGLIAPAEEAVRFLQALVSRKLLKPAALEAMRQFRPIPPLGMPNPDAKPGEKTDGYGMGLVRMKRAGEELIGHGGLYTGHTAGLWHLPERNITIALYFNRGFVEQRKALDQIVPALTQKPSP